MPDWTPPWSEDSAHALSNTEQRHEWMCKQLVMRRETQMQLSKHASGKGAVAINWYERRLSSLHPNVEIENIVEVISDGLGFIEPNWSALYAATHEAEGIARYSEQQLKSTRETVRKERDKLAFPGNVIRFKTQRAIGCDLYEPSIFLIMKDAVYFCQSHKLDEGAGESVCEWQPVDKADLRLKKVGHELDTAKGEISKSLYDLTSKVLWPAFFPHLEDPSFFSLVLIYTSLWQETAGVWALHASCNNRLNTPPEAIKIADLRNLIEAPIFCLEDVLGWSYEFEGTHSLKRHNVNFLYECQGMSQPVWTADGIVESPSRQKARDVIRAAYELSADRMLPDSTREIFQRAVDLCCHLKRLGNYAHEKLDEKALKIVRSIDAAVVGVRLYDAELEIFNPSQKPKFISDMPDSVVPYLIFAEIELEMKEASGRICDTLERAKAIAEEVEHQLEHLRDTQGAAYCQVVLECYRNYLQPVEARKLAASPPQSTGEAHG